MITIRKLASLPETTKMRKCARLLDELVYRLRYEKEVDQRYIKEVLKVVEASPVSSLGVKQACKQALTADVLLWREVGDVVLLLHNELNLAWADWDLKDEQELTEAKEKAPFTLVMDRIRSPFNVGSLFRTAESFGVGKVLVITPGASPLHPRSVRSSRGSIKKVDWLSVSEQEALELLDSVPLFALETGGTAVNQFSFPSEGAVIVGSEELGVSPKLLKAADESKGRVTIPLYGTKGSLNVSVAFGILIASWHAQVHVKR